MLRANLKEKIDYFLYFIHNILANLLFYVSPSKKYVLKNILLKNKHLGESCIIMGNGPSLKDFNPIKLKDKKTFVTNFFYSSDLFENFTPDYYTLVDEAFYFKYISSTQEALAKYKDTTFLFKHKCLQNPDLTKLILNHKKFIISYNQIFPYDDKIELDFEKNITASINVINHCILAALYMGFKKIYLVGCDFNTFTSKKSLYFYSDSKSPQNLNRLGDELSYYGIVAKHHYAISKKAKLLNAEILNATPNSLLDAYPLSDII